MHRIRTGVTAAVLVLMAHGLAAQDTTQGPPPRRARQVMAGDSAMMRQHMQAMDSMNAHFDSLVNQMNTATGDQKVSAMADVLNALVAERRMMQTHMRQMAGARRGGAGMRRRERRPRSATDSSAADTGRAGQRPPR